MQLKKSYTDATVCILKVTGREREKRVEKWRGVLNGAILPSAQCLALKAPLLLGSADLRRDGLCFSESVLSDCEQGQGHTLPRSIYSYQMLPFYDPQSQRRRGPSIQQWSLSQEKSLSNYSGLRGSTFIKDMKEVFVFIFEVLWTAYNFDDCRSWWPSVKVTTELKMAYHLAALKLNGCIKKRRMD